MDLIFTPAFILRCFYLLVIVIAAFSLQMHLPSAQAYWLVWVMLPAALMQCGDTVLHRMGYIFLTGVIATCAVMLAALVTQVFPLLVIYLFIITLGCMLLGQRKAEYFYLFFIINFLTILSSLFPAHAGAILERGAIVLSGFAITMLLQLIVAYRFRRKELDAAIVLAMRQLENLNTEIFSCLLEPEYANNIYLFEKRLHMAKYKCAQTYARLLELARANGVEDIPLPTTVEESETITIWQNINKIYEIMLDYAQLRRRVTDHSTFSLCAEELAQIKIAIEQCLQQVTQLLRKKKYHLSTVPLNAAIKQFEANYQNVLGVSAREPLVFLLFIFSLQLLRERFMAFGEGQ